MLDHVWLIKTSQIGIITFELMSPIIFFVKDRFRPYIVGYFYLFHLFTWLAITISFAPHLIAMTTFVHLERVRPLHWIRLGFDRMRGRQRRPTEPDAAEPSPTTG